MKKLSFITLLIAASALCACAGVQKDAENDVADAARGACPDAKRVRAADLYGDWRARFDKKIAGAADEARVSFEPHQESEGALAGRIVRPATTTQRSTTSVLAGGIADGEFGIEESEDGRRISGLWNGSVTVGSCGREIRGTWIDPADDSERGFVLRRTDDARR